MRPPYYRSYYMVTTTSLERKKRDKVGVVGLGGLGHMGVKFANALECCYDYNISEKRKRC
jgi:D-arabinose 1-dehydrogenase-like Zn-dependent alcohol dehydrogenase